jgi:DNA-binding NtrC family response regulator
MKWLKGLSLPGNIRQLKNIVERAVLLAPRQELQVADFQKHLQAPVADKDSARLPETGTMTLEEMEFQMIRRAMEFHNNKVSKVARALGITRFALYRRLEKFNIPYNTEE